MHVVTKSHSDVPSCQITLHVVQLLAKLPSICVSPLCCRQELLQGPLLYIAIVVSITLIFWRDSPVSLLALCLMCGGDGLADIVGRTYGTVKLPFNHKKSWAGSFAMFAGKTFAKQTLKNCDEHSAYAAAR